MLKPWLKQYDPWFKESMQYPDLTLYEIVARTSKKYPDYDALSFMGQSISYQTLLALIDQAAASLKQLGFVKNDVAAICLPNTPQAVILFYAVNRLGGICNMIHPLTPADELSHYIKTTKSDYLIILDAFLTKHTSMLSSSRIRKVIVASINDYLKPVMKIGFYISKGRKIKPVPRQPRYVKWRDFIAMSNSGEPYKRLISAKDCAVYLHSGGTTGLPKTIMLSSYSFNVLATQGPQLIGIKDMDQFDPKGLAMVTILPLFHGFGLCMGMHTMLSIGLKAILVPQFSPDVLAKVLIKEKPAYIAAVPTLFEGILQNEKLKNADLSCLQSIFCGGDTLTVELKHRFDAFLEQRGSKCVLREGYGLTETVTVCAVNPMLDAREKSIGVPLSDVLIKVIDPETLKEVKPGQSGEFCVHAPTMMLGYLNDPEATAETIRRHPDGLDWVHTGDFGTMESSGYFYFKQRIKRIIKVSGIPVFPSQIEDAICEVSGVRMACAIGVPHPYKMQIVKAFVVLNSAETDKHRMEKLILDHCESKMLQYAVPKEIEFREDLPRTKVGKIDFVSLERIEMEKLSQDKQLQSDSV